MSVGEEMFELFTEMVGPRTYSDPVPNNALATYKNILPDQLLEYWKEEGWAAYANGLVWIVNPADYSDLVSLWLKDTPYPEIDTYHVIARSAFGALYLWGENNKQTFTINPAYNYIYSDTTKLKTMNDVPGQTIRGFFGGSEYEDYDMEDMDLSLIHI